MARRGRRRRAESPYLEQAGFLSEQLRDLRERAGLTQQQLAASAGVALGTVRNIERGIVVEPGYFTITALLRALGARPADLPARE